MNVIVIAIVVLLALAALAVFATARRQVSTGKLSRETQKRDQSAVTAQGATADPEAGGRERADQARDGIGHDLATRSGSDVAVAAPIDEEALGVTRRQFFNRGILAGMGVAVGAFGVAALGFVWPSLAGGFGGKVTVGSKDDVDEAWGKKIPFYNVGAKTYVQPYPQDALPKAKKAYGAQPPVLTGMEAGYLALYQKCPHLGCRVPWCDTSQWFECPCHGSKYNRVGEKKGGPAPRGLDRFGVELSGDNIVVDTGRIWTGPPIGTNTTGQGQEGAACV